MSALRLSFKGKGAMTVDVKEFEFLLVPVICTDSPANYPTTVSAAIRLSIKGSRRHLILLILPQLLV